MPIHVIWERSDGSIVKGLRDCAVPSPTTKDIVDSDLNHGVIRPGETTVPQIFTIKTFSWPRNGDPSNPITDAGVFLTSYYNADPTFLPDSGFSFCGGASSVAFGSYTDSSGSHSAASDLAALQGFGDAATGGVQVSLDLGRNYTTFTSSVGIITSPILLAATSMDVGTVDGQLTPGDRATIYVRIKIPLTYTSSQNAGVYLFNLGLFYNFSE